MRKEKGRECERHLCKGHPPWHKPTEFVWYMTMYTVCFLYKEIQYLATERQLNTSTSICTAVVSICTAVVC